jgi:transposase
MRAYSEDLRERIIGARSQGQSSAEVAKRFGVSVRAVDRYWQRYRERGHWRIGKIGGHLRSRLDAHEARLRDWIAESPDQTLEELRVRCGEELGVRISVSGLWYRLKAMGISFKKK